jgi:hypothetical protein
VHAVQKIEAKLNQLDKLMTLLEPLAAAVSSRAGGKPQAVVVADGAYQDANDANIAAGEALEALSEEKLSPQAKLRLAFGHQLLQMIGLPDVRLHIAKTLPAAKNTQNAFAHSYLYLHDEKQLFVHANRLASSGDFGVTVIHAASHIQVSPCNPERVINRSLVMLCMTRAIARLTHWICLTTTSRSSCTSSTTT